MLGFPRKTVAVVKSVGTPKPLGVVDCDGILCAAGDGSLGGSGLLAGDGWRWDEAEDIRLRGAFILWKDTVRPLSGRSASVFLFIPRCFRTEEKHSTSDTTGAKACSQSATTLSIGGDGDGNPCSWQYS